MTGFTSISAFFSAETASVSTRIQVAAAGCACAGVTAFLYTVDPNRAAVYPHCLIYQATGMYCAGCGATRALHALLHGRVADALRDNALFLTLLPVVLLVTGAHLWKAWRDNHWPGIGFTRLRVIRWASWLLLLMAGFVVLRNLPGWPFDYLKPLAG